jgi:hypothetical protein
MRHGTSSLFCRFFFWEPWFCIRRAMVMNLKNRNENRRGSFPVSNNRRPLAVNFVHFGRHKILQWEKVHWYSLSRRKGRWPDSRERERRWRECGAQSLLCLLLWRNGPNSSSSAIVNRQQPTIISQSFQQKNKINRSWGCFSRTSQTDGTLSSVSIVRKPSSSTHAVSLCCELVGVCVFLFASVTVP